MARIKESLNSFFFGEERKKINKQIIGFFVNTKFTKRLYFKGVIDIKQLEK